MIDDILDGLHDACGISLNAKQREGLRLEFVSYALAALMDSTVREEVETICEDFAAEEEAKELSVEQDYQRYKAESGE